MRDATGPALRGVYERAPSKEWIYQFVRNPQELIASGDDYANKLFKKWDGIAMTAFPTLTDAEIDAILDFVSAQEQR